MIDTELLLKSHVHSNHNATAIYATQNAGNTTNECGSPQVDRTLTDVKSTWMDDTVQSVYIGVLYFPL